MEEVVQIHTWNNAMMVSGIILNETGDMSYRITPGLWFRKGTPVMIITLITSTIIMWTFFDFYARPLGS